MGLAAGDLNRQIIIQRRVPGETPEGQPVDVWVDVATVWASIRGQTGMGSITGLQDDVAASIERYSYRIRYRTGIDAGMRIYEVATGDVADIRQVRMDRAHREWTDLVTEVGGNEG